MLQIEFNTPPCTPHFPFYLNMINIKKIAYVRFHSYLNAFNVYSWYVLHVSINNMYFKVCSYNLHKWYLIEFVLLVLLCFTQCYILKTRQCLDMHGANSCIFIAVSHSIVCICFNLCILPTYELCVHYYKQPIILWKQTGFIVTTTWWLIDSISQGWNLSPLYINKNIISLLSSWNSD